MSDNPALTWVEGREKLEALAGEWSALASRTEADIYVTPDWVRTWWDHFGQGRRLLALVARQGDALTGLVPFMVERVWAGPVPMRVARIAATDPYSVIFRLPVEEGLCAPMLERACADLPARFGADAVSFTPVSERSELLPAVRAAAGNGSGLALTDDDAGTHTLFDLPETFDTYLKSLSKKRRAQFRRDLKRLQEDHGLTGSLEHPDAEGFDAFVDFHNRQWQATGQGGHFADWRGSAGFYRDLAARLRGQGQVWIDRQDDPEGPLAAQFSLVAGPTCHWRLPARRLDPELEKLSLGKVGLILMIERLIAAGVRRIEAGTGAYDYKLVYGGEAVPVHRMIIAPAGVAPRAQLRLLLSWSDALNFLYYRAWFLRAAPRLRPYGLFKGPLWGAWIRTRL